MGRFAFLAGIVGISVSFAVWSGCATPGAPRTLVLPYDDFGPQAMAHELLGMEWFSWQPHGDSNPRTEYNVRVVVYRGRNLAEARRLFPVRPEREQDFRYIEVETALKYLDRQLKLPEVVDLPRLSTRLRATRERIRREFETD